MEFLSSPNFNARRAGSQIKHLILHYTDTPDLQMAVDFLMDPAREVSAHYVVDIDGSIIQMVDEANRAWHAGVSFWAGETDINSTSIGIEIVNPGHTFGHQPFPPAQISAVIDLCQGIIARHNILPQHVLAHSDIAPMRKQDPGELFPWQLLAENGVGLFPPPLAPPARGGEYILDNQKLSSPLAGEDKGGGVASETLRKYGYDVTDLSATIAAFQRHFRPEIINGEWDGECDARLKSLMAVIQRG